MKKRTKKINWQLVLAILAAITVLIRAVIELVQILK
jgi:hypothetical protein